jgi:PBP1b-binding outer membrane lipoprotein LpoB
MKKTIISIMLIAAGIFTVSCGSSTVTRTPNITVSVSPGVLLSKKTPIVVTAEYRSEVLSTETALQQNSYRVVSAATSIDRYPNIDVLLEALQSSTVYVMYVDYNGAYYGKLKITDQKTGLIVLSAEWEDIRDFKKVVAEMDKYFR